MDHRDEFKKDVRDDEIPASSEERAGDVLGLGRGPAPKAPGDPVASNDPESVGRRRERMAGDEGGTVTTGTDQSSGATSIDMGSGGNGTDLSGE